MNNPTSPKKDDSIILPAAVAAPDGNKKDEAAKTPDANGAKKQ